MGSIIKNMPTSEYFAIKALSASGAKLLRRSAAHYLASTTSNREPTGAMKLGTLTHTLLFEPSAFEEEYAIAPMFDKRTNIGKKAALEFGEDNAGKKILDESELLRAKAISEAARGNPVVQEYFEKGGEAETVFLWEQYGVPCKARMDFISGNTILDLKTCKDASPEGFAKQIGSFQYHMQAAFYIDGFRLVTGNDAKFVFIAVESEAPYAVGIYEIDAASLASGGRAMRSAAETYKEAQKPQQDHPCYTTGIRTLAIPSWALNEPFDNW